MLVFATFLKRYWRVLAALAVAAAILYLISNAINGAIEDADARGYGRARGEMAAQVAAANAHTASVESAARTRIHTLEIEHAESLSTLDAERRATAARIGPVRVRECASTSRSQVPGSSTATALDHDTARDGGIPAGAGEAADIGPQLTELMAVAKRQALMLLACQRYAAEVSAPR